MNFTLRKKQYHIVCPNYGPCLRLQAIGFHYRYIKFDGMPCHRQLGGLLMRLRRKKDLDGQVEDNLKELVLLVLMWEYNVFHIMGASRTRPVLFFSTYLGRFERDSAPFCSLSTSVPPQLIVAPSPKPKKRLMIQGGPTKEATSQRPTRLVNILIAPLLPQ